MAIEKSNGVVNLTEGLSGALGNITKTLTDLMNSIMKPINKLLEDLGFKQKIETNNTIDKSKIDLKKLMEEIKEDVDDKRKLNDKEKIILDGVLDKNKNLKSNLDRIEKEFGEDAKELEGKHFLAYLLKETDGGKIEQSEIDDIIKEMKENKEKIEKDEKLKNIITEITKDEELEEKHSLKAIVDAYNKTKEQVDSGEDISLTKDVVLNNIINFGS